MKTSYLKIWIIINVLMVSFLYCGDPEKELPLFRIFQGSKLQNELLEGVTMAGLLYTDLQLKKQKAWFEDPWLPSKLDRVGSDQLTKDIIPISWINLAGIVPNVAIFILPNNEGFYNSLNYRHAKGFAEAVYIVTPFFTDIAKLSFGKKRPNYNALTKDGGEPVNARKSFWSLHAATSFAIATYTSLYMFAHVGENWKKHLGVKVPVAAVLYASAALVWLSRDANLDHDDVDLVVGASFGTIMSTFIFTIHENWIFKIYQPKMKVGFLGGYNQLLLSFDF